jgi:hypothetical protein
VKHVAAFAAGIGLAILRGFGVRMRRGRELATRVRGFNQRLTRTVLDLNSASREQLLGLGLEPSQADRIVEGRPYRNKLELVSRIMLPSDVYSSIKGRVTASGPQDAVKVAS